MDALMRDVVRDCSRASDENSQSFPVVVGRLMQAGVERYHADLVRSEKTFYAPDGSSEIVASDAVPASPAIDFAALEVEAAIREIQRGGMTYRTFCERIAAAGCVGYHVSIAGRRAVYYGRTGETHVEPFPKPGE